MHIVKFVMNSLVHNHFDEQTCAQNDFLTPAEHVKN